MSLKFLYKTKLGRILLKVLTMPFISKVIGVFLSTKLSTILIKRFIKKNNIDMSDYEVVKYKSFNDFFTRKIKKNKRIIDKDKNSFIAPSDGYLSVYKIKKDLILPIKQSEFTINSILKNDVLAKDYNDGYCLVFRLCVNNYHRYCYIDDGYKNENIFIKGKLHTVRPIALETLSVFSENAREYTVLETKNFDKVVEIEVGALMVGKIKNYHTNYEYKKGEEKGMFLFGGSTIILLVKKNQIKILDKYLKNEEISVKMGEKIGIKI